MLRRVINGSVMVGVRLIDLLRLRRPIRWMLHHVPRRVRLWTTRALVRLGVDAPLIYASPVALKRCFEGGLALVPGSHVAVYLEFGVYIGTTMIAMHRAGRASGRRLRLIGFDSFQGLPAGAADETEGLWHEGQYYSDVRLTQANLRRHGVPPKDVELVPGWYEESLTDSTADALRLSSVDVVMIDCDLGSSTRRALDFCTPMLQRTLLFFDDWDLMNLPERGLGEAEAFQSWRVDHPEFQVVEHPDLRYKSSSRAFLVTRADAD